MSKLIPGVFGSANGGVGGVDSEGVDGCIGGGGGGGGSASAPIVLLN